MTVKADPDAGLDADVRVDFGELSCYGTVYLPGGTDISQLAFSWDDPALTVERDGVTYESGTAPVANAGECITYTVSKGHVYMLMTVRTMQGSEGVEPMFLELDESLGTIAAMNADEDHETQCFGRVLFDDQEYPYMSMKGRGNSTWDYEKKPYNLTFFKASDYNKKQNVTLIEGTKAKKWSLLANYMDPSFLRNKVALELASDLGIGLPTRYVDLYMNGEYLGLYLLTPKSDYDAPDDGYILENDNYPSSDDPQFSLDGMWNIGLVGACNYMTIKDIGDGAAEAGATAESIEAHFKEAWNALRDYDSDGYTKYFDVDSWAKIYLMYEMCKVYDAFAGSILMHRDGLGEDDLLTAGPGWDYDMCLGRTLYKLVSGITLPSQLDADGWYIDSIGLVYQQDSVSLLQEFGKHADFMRRVSEIFNEYKWAFNAVDDNIYAQEAVIGDSARMDEGVWDLNHFNAYGVIAPTVIGYGKYQLNYQVTDSWEAYVANMHEYVNKRLAWLSDHLYAEAPVGQITGETTVQEYGTLTLNAELTSGANENTFQWQSSKKGKTWDNIEGATAETLQLKITADKDGWKYRCIVTNEGVAIENLHTPTVNASAQTILEPVTIKVKEHKHSYKDTVVPPTCTVKGYTLHSCSCGESTRDTYVDELHHHYVKGFCEHCGEKDPDATVKTKKVSTALAEEKLILALGGKEMGEFTFARKDGGWTIQNGNAKYLAVDRSDLILSTKPFVWKFSNNVFSADTKVSLTSIGKALGISYKATAYLYSDSKGLTVSVLLSRKATFLKEIQYVA